MQELASKKDQPALRTDRDAFEPHLDFVSPAALDAAFKRSDIFAKTRQELDAPYDREESHPGSLMKARYGVPGWDALKALWWRDRCALLVFGGYTCNVACCVHRWCATNKLQQLVRVCLQRHALRKEFSLQATLPYRMRTIGVVQGAAAAHVVGPEVPLVQHELPALCHFHALCAPRSVQPRHSAGALLLSTCS